MTGLHFQQFYIDPVSGYVFHSKKDVQRFLKSGDIAKCAIKPSRRQYQDEDNSTVRHFCMKPISLLLLLLSVISSNSKLLKD